MKRRSSVRRTGRDRRPGGSPGTVRRWRRPRRADGGRTAGTGRTFGEPPGVSGKRSGRCAAWTRHSCRRTSGRPPWRWRSGGGPPRGASRRTARTGAVPARRGCVRTWCRRPGRRGRQPAAGPAPAHTREPSPGSSAACRRRAAAHPALGRRHGPSRRRAGRGCAWVRADASRTSGTGRRRDVRRCAGRTARGRAPYALLDPCGAWGISGRGGSRDGGTPPGAGTAGRLPARGRRDVPGASGMPLNPSGGAPRKSPSRASPTTARHNSAT